MLRRTILALCGAAFVGGPALADQKDPALGPLFEKLRAAGTPEEARTLEQAIGAIWAKSGSAAVDYLMASGYGALANEDYSAAQSLFASVTDMAPDFAEGWSKRATAYFLMEDYRNAVVTLEHVLKLEPRHYDALYGLSNIFEDMGDKKRALAALRAASRIDPQLDGLARREKELSKDVEGRGI